MKTSFTRLSVNVVGKPRFAAMEGRDYIVLPVVIMMEGVHNGSNGPTLYTLEEMQKYSPAWNLKPVVVNHPKNEVGEFISAAAPAILTATKVGVLMSSTIEGKGQKAEAWLEKSRLKEVDDRILDRIDEGLIVEVSTGLFAFNEEKTGEWNGENYEYIARNFAPDHLALLPDTIGACSIEDGCGLFTASQKMTVNKAKQLQSRMKNVMTNELSHSEVWSALYEKIQPPPTEYSWIDDVYDDYFIYCKGDYHYKQEYTLKDDVVTLVGEPTTVERKITYNSQNGEKTMSKENCTCTQEVKTLADKLISANTDWTEENREWLQKQDKPILEKFATMQDAKKAAPKVEPKKEEEEKVEPVVNTTVPGTKKQEVSVEEYIANSPAPIREMLVRGLQAQEAQKSRYIDIIVSNEDNKFTKEELATMKPEMLEKLASLAVGTKEKEASPQLMDLFNHVGAGGAPQNIQSNSEEHLPLPSLSFDKK